MTIYLENIPVDGRNSGRGARRRAPPHCPVSSKRITALAVSILLGLALSPQAARAQHAAMPVRIAAQPLETALLQLATAYGLEVAYAPDTVKGINAPSVSGDLTADQALRRLLAGTGIEFERDGKKVSLSRPAAPVATMPTVAVTAAVADGDLPPTLAGGQLARGGRLGLLGNTDVMNAPFNVTNFTSGYLANQQAVTLADVVARDPSVRFTGQIGGVTDSFFIRGFPIGEGNLGEIAFDGVYGVAGNYHVFSTYVERVEVLKGPGALLYGMSPNSGVGGVINIVPKRSLPEDLSRVTADYASRGQAGGQVDLSRRFGVDGQWGIRVNGMHRQGDTPLDKQNAKTDIGALSLDYRGERLRASLDTIFQEENIDAPTRPMLVKSGLDIPDAPNGHRNVTQSWGWWKSHGQSALLHGEYDVTDHVTAFADVGGSHTGVSRLSDQTPTILDSRGDTTSTPQYARFSVNRYTADVGVRMRGDTGPVRHAVTLMGSVYRDRLAQAFNAGSPMLSNIYSPTSSPEQDIPRPGLPKVSQSRLSGVALADTLGVLDDRIQLTLGVRQQRIESDNYNANTGARTTSYDKSATTPLAGLVVKPWENVSLYANYIEGLSKGDVAPATASNAGQVFSPYKTRQKEIGVKFDMDAFVATVSAFEITKPSGILNGTVYEASGEQRNRGLEFSVSGEPAKGMRLLSGVTLINARLTQTNSSATQGNRAVGVPRVAANLSGEVDLPWVQGLTLNANVTYTGQQYLDQANTQSLPSWTTVDLGARYTAKVYGRNTTFRFMVLNAFNRAYWAGAASYGTISQGIPRTVMVSTSVDF